MNKKPANVGITTIAVPSGPAKELPQQGAIQAQPAVKAADNQSALLALLKVEAAARDAASERDLLLLMANETRKLTRARQVFVFRPGLRRDFEIRGISSVPVVERNAPVVVLMESLVKAGARKADLEMSRVIEWPAAQPSGPSEQYPFRALHWVPLKHGGQSAIGGLLLAREDSWSEQDLVVATRLASAYAHAFRALNGGVKKRAWTVSKLHGLAALAAVIAALIFVKVPLQALAPVEIAPQDPFIVAAPTDGVIEAIPVNPNQSVKSGELLVKLADTTLRNRFEVAEREVQVAEARLKQANQVAFSDARGMHELGIARAELSLKLAERDFARDLLAKSEIRAEREGLAIYADKRELIGRPVAVGERILEIAEASKIEAKIELPVADAIALTPGARVKLFLDSDPLEPWSASIERAGYKARIGDNDVVSFGVVASIVAEADRPLPRLGVRGTAQLSGDDVPLGLYLFRRPISHARQWLGF